MNYTQTIAYLYQQLPVFHRIGPAAYKPDLGNIEALCQLLGQPHLKFKSVHIAGTNGKGSVSHMLASILQSAGYKAGLHTSPHLKDYRERFRINGRMIGKREVIRFVTSHKAAFERIKPSFFEMSVALAFDYFARQQVDIAVIETGMGGRLDSTNVIMPEVSVITNIGWDHMTFLGDTLAKIAVEKAGIIKPNTPAVVGESHPDTHEVFTGKAKSVNAPLTFADQHYRVQKVRSGNFLGSEYSVSASGMVVHDKLLCPLNGNYQQHNLITVLRTIDVLKSKGYNISNQIIRDGIAKVVKQTGFRGRWQVLGRNPLTIADVGHNKDGLTWVLNQITETPHRHLHFVFGMVNDKDIDAVLDMLPRSATYYFCKPDIPRGLSVQVLTEKADIARLNGQAYGSVKEALAAARKQAGKDDLVFVGGSTFVVAEVV